MDCRWNSGVCFRSGEIPHKVAECPKKDKSGDTPNKVTVVALRPNNGRVYEPPTGLE